MGRPSNGMPRERYSTTISAELAARWTAHAGKKANATAARLLERAMEHAMNDGDALDLDADSSHPQAADAGRLASVERRLEEAERQIEELTIRLVKVQRERQEPAASSTVVEHAAGQPGARWEWPLKALLADEGWWDVWLPRLYELLGHNVPRQLTDADKPAARDERGYVDLMVLLFPPIGGADWRSPAYGAAALAAAPTQASALLARAPHRGHAWEPVVRHVVEALCALESTGAEGTEAYLRLRAKAEIIGPWAEALLHLLGERQLRQRPAARPVGLAKRQHAVSGLASRREVPRGVEPTRRLTRQGCLVEWSNPWRGISVVGAEGGRRLVERARALRSMSQTGQAARLHGAQAGLQARVASASGKLRPSGSGRFHGGGRTPHVQFEVGFGRGHVGTQLHGVADLRQLPRPIEVTGRVGVPPRVVSHPSCHLSQRGSGRE
jgi:hypothetical protein